MSRAFVNEDQGIAELPVAARAVIPEGAPNWVTPRGLDMLQREHEDLDNEISEEPDAARQAVLRQRQAELYYRLATAQIIDLSSHPPVEIRFGATVQLKGGKDQESFVVTIVGADEADPASNLLSIHSPLARALLGKLPTQTVMLTTEEGEEITMEILDVHYGSLGQ